MRFELKKYEWHDLWMIEIVCFQVSFLLIKDLKVFYEVTFAVF